MEEKLLPLIMPGSERHYQRYMKLVNFYRDEPRSAETEAHHVLPKSIFPEFAKEKWNIVHMPTRAHFIAHWLLAKFIGGKMWFAFNVMSRSIQGDKKLSRLYVTSRKFVGEQVSKSNAGRKLSEERRANIAAQMAGMMTVRDKFGTHMLAHKDDPRVISGELVHRAVGSKHSSATKLKMAKARGKYRVSYYCADGIVRMAASHLDVPEGCSLGHPQHLKDKRSASVSASRWYNCPSTGKNIRCVPGCEPTGFIAGRTCGVGFSLINKKRRSNNE